MGTIVVPLLLLAISKIAGAPASRSAGPPVPVNSETWGTRKRDMLWVAAVPAPAPIC